MVPLAFSILQNVFVLLIHWVADALSLGLKRPEREADNSPPSNSEITNTLGYISTSHMRSQFSEAQFYVYFTVAYVLRPRCKPKCVWEDNIKIDPKGIICDDVDDIYQVCDRNLWRAVANRVVNLLVPEKADGLLTNKFLQIDFAPCSQLFFVVLLYLSEIYVVCVCVFVTVPTRASLQTTVGLFEIVTIYLCRVSGTGVFYLRLNSVQAKVLVFQLSHFLEDATLPGDVIGNDQ